MQPPDPANLEYTTAEMHVMGTAVLERVIAFIETLGSQPACGDLRVEPQCRALRERAPEAGTPLDPLLAQLFDEWIPHSFNAAGPGYLAYIPGGGLFPAALADLISNGTNRYTGIWQAAPLLVQLEANVLDWFRDWMGFPPTTRGLFTTGGSMASFNAIVCARERHLGPDIRRGVLYTSSEVHHSVLKSARLAGVMPDRVCEIPVDAAFRMRVDALADAIARDRRRGWRPFLVVSSAGTTNTGAVDPLEAIADVCHREALWHHVDGAYGAFFSLCDALRPTLAGLSRADSLTLDPHKGLFLPYGTGALLVREGAHLRAVHGAAAGYLPSAPDPGEFYDPSQHGPDLSRGFPGLRVWLAVKLFGTARLRAAIAEKRALAVSAAAALGDHPGIVMVAPPELSLLAFHLDWPGASQEDRNAATAALIDRVNARGTVMLTGCTTGGRVLARVCVLSFRTRAPLVDVCVAQIQEEADRLCREWTGASGRQRSAILTAPMPPVSGTAGSRRAASVAGPGGGAGEIGD